MCSGHLLFDGPMHSKMDERALPKGEILFPSRTPTEIYEGLVGIGMEGSTLTTITGQGIGKPGAFRNGNGNVRHRIGINKI